MEVQNESNESNMLKTTIAQVVTTCSIDVKRASLTLTKKISSIKNFFNENISHLNPYPIDNHRSHQMKNVLSETAVMLKALKNKGILDKLAIIIGNENDPFSSLKGDLATTLQLLQLFTEYKPGALYLQTRSPLSVLALPVFTKLKDRCAINFYLETDDEFSIQRYLPTTPKFNERIKAIRTLKRFGIETNIVVNPLLPTKYRDEVGICSFAQLISENCSHAFVSTQPLLKTSNSYTKTLCYKLLNDGEEEYITNTASVKLKKYLKRQRDNIFDLTIKETLKNQPDKIFAA